MPLSSTNLALSPSRSSRPGTLPWARTAPVYSLATITASRYQAPRIRACLSPLPQLPHPRSWARNPSSQVRARNARAITSSKRAIRVTTSNRIRKFQPRISVLVIPPPLPLPSPLSQGLSPFPIPIASLSD